MNILYTLIINIILLICINGQWIFTTREPVSIPTMLPMVINIIINLYNYY